MNQLRAVIKSASTMALLLAITASPLSADVVFDDSFADGDRAATGATDTNWWTSSSSSGIKAASGALGLVTGTSGRGIHTTFATQTLTNVGDMLTASYTFTTPNTIGATSSSFRVGMFDTLGRNLDQDISASSSSPNALYGLAGTADGLPGYMLDMDVNTGASADLNFREHNIGAATGRLMATTGSGSFSSFSSGPDEGYTFASDTTYTGTYTIKLISPTELELTGTLGGVSYSVVDDSFTSSSFGFLGFHVNSNTFGSSNSQGAPDNGIDFSNINVVFTPAPVPEPSSAIILMGGLVSLGLMRRRNG